MLVIVQGDALGGIRGAAAQLAEQFFELNRRLRAVDSRSHPLQRGVDPRLLVRLEQEIDRLDFERLDCVGIVCGRENHVRTIVQPLEDFEAADIRQS